MQPTQAEPFNFKTDERIEKRLEKETCKVSLKCVSINTVKSLGDLLQAIFWR